MQDDQGIRGYCRYDGVLVYAGCVPDYTQHLVCQWCGADNSTPPTVVQRLGRALRLIRKQIHYYGFCQGLTYKSVRELWYLERELDRKGE